MNFRNALLWISLVSLLALSACNEPSLIGSDLLEEDRIEVTFTDTLSLIPSHLRPDSLLVYGPSVNQQLDNYLFGQYMDPFFGITTSTITAQARLDLDPPDFEDAVLDSIVLSLPYTNASYGNLEGPYELEVRLLEQNINRDQEIYSTRTFSSTEVIGTATFMPAPEDSVTLDLYGSDEGGTLDLGPQLRIRLDDAFGQQLINADPAVFSNDTTFLEAFPGIQIVPTSTNQGLLAFDLTDIAAGITVFSRVDTVFNDYTFEFNSSSVKTVTYEHDIDGYPVRDFLTTPSLGDSLMLVQGMTGVSTVLEIPYIEDFEDRLINKAELELTVVYPDGASQEDYPPINQLVISEILGRKRATNWGSQLTVIDDVFFALSNNELSQVFGGTPIEEEDGRFVYRMNISAYFKELKNGNASRYLLITAFPRAEVGGRVIMGGPGHPEFPAILKLSFTNYE